MPDVAPAVDTALKSVLIATDFSKASDKPLRHALAIARHYRANFYLAHIVSSLGYTIAGPEAYRLAGEAAARDAMQLERELVESGSLAGMPHEFIIRQGANIWEELKLVIQQKEADLIAVGTHGRHSFGKLLLGSVAEQIFRRADCPVLTVGPGSYQHSPLENIRPFRPFLFATDFGEASLHALPRAISFANHFGTRLVFLHVAPIAPIPEGFHWSKTTTDVRQMQEEVRRGVLRKLEEIASRNGALNAEPEFRVEFGAPSKMILHAAGALGADLIVMGLNRSRLIDTASHMPWATAYEVVRGAVCPVLTVRS
jgi:nucleotide-binding universal stress UspA family protein